MFTKPVNFASEINKPKRKTRFNGYVLCFLFLILCILLILAYRIEVKIIQQNLRKNYDDYIEEIKKGLADEENILILEKNNYDTHKNGEDYEIIVETIDNETQFDPTEHKYPKIDGHSSTILEEKSTTVEDSGETTENNASERNSAEEKVTTDSDDYPESESSEEDDDYKNETTKLVDKTTTKSKLIESITKGTGSTTLNTPNKIVSLKDTTTKAVPVAVYITESVKVNSNTATTKINLKETYDPNNPGDVLVIQIDDPDADYADRINTMKTKSTTTSGSTKNNPTKINISNSTKNNTESVEEEDYDDSIHFPDSEEINKNFQKAADEIEKHIQETFNRQNEEIDPPNERIDVFQSNIQHINNVMNRIHQQVSKDISQSMADMDKGMSLVRVDFDLDPFHDEEKVKKSTSKSVDFDERDLFDDDEAILE